MSKAINVFETLKQNGGPLVSGRESKLSVFSNLETGNSAKYELYQLYLCI